MTPCSLFKFANISEKLTVAIFSVGECNKNGGYKFLRKTGKFLRGSMASHLRRQ